MCLPYLVLLYHSLLPGKILSTNLKFKYRQKLIKYLIGDLKGIVEDLNRILFGSTLLVVISGCQFFMVGIAIELAVVLL